jgi:hypothetical protein
MDGRSVLAPVDVQIDSRCIVATIPRDRSDQDVQLVLVQLDFIEHGRLRHLLAQRYDPLGKKRTFPPSNGQGVVVHDPSPASIMTDPRAFGTGPWRSRRTSIPSRKDAIRVGSQSALRNPSEQFRKVER